MRGNSFSDLECVGEIEFGTKEKIEGEKIGICEP